MISLTERQVDRARGVLIIPHPKEKRPKIIPLIKNDREILLSIPLYYNPNAPFFRHEGGISGATPGEPFGPRQLYRAWKRACSVLGIDGVDLYGGTKHSTAMGVRKLATFEEVRLMTGHRTNPSFERYFRTEGDALQTLYTKRDAAIEADNALITDSDNPKEAKVLNFTKKFGGGGGN